LTIPTAVPSITQILENPNQGTYNYLNSVFWIIFILLILVNAFLKGGFLGCVLAGVREQKVDAGTFIRTAKKYFIRFLLQFLITFILLIVLAKFLFVEGQLAILFLVGIIILLFYLIFWDYIIVVENARLVDAAKISFSLVKSNLGKVLSFVIPIYIITALFSVIANLLIAASPILAVIVIAVYAYFGTAVVFTMMIFYLESMRNTDFTGY
jgi:hypothetical protein